MWDYVLGLIVFFYVVLCWHPWEISSFLREDGMGQIGGKNKEEGRGEGGEIAVKIKHMRER